MRYYYAIIQKDDYGNMICNGTLDTFVKKTDSEYIEIAAGEFEQVLGKMWTGTEFVQNPNPVKGEEEEV